MSSEPGSSPPRCAHHPARPAHDRCPRCGRSRCDADAASYESRGCAVCRGLGHPPRAVPLAEVVLRAGAVTVPVAAAGGWIATQYVYDHVFSLVVPGLIGFGCALAAGGANRRRDRLALIVVVLIAAAGGVAGTALGFHLVPGGRQSVLRPFDVVGAPYLCTVLGAIGWLALFGTTRVPDRDDPG